MPPPTKKAPTSKKPRSARRKPPAQNKNTTPPTAGEWFEKLVAVQKRLRAPNGCPWDREQTHATLRTYLIEEAYEVLDALDSGDDAKFAEEMGDLLLQVVFHSEIAREQSRFTVADVVREIHDKMIRRHPHVFGKVHAKNSAQVLKHWESIKAQERLEKKIAPANGETKLLKEKPASLLDGVSRNLPAVLEGLQLTRKAARAGFDWHDAEGIFEKLREEMAEVRHVLNEKEPKKAEEELGDLLFAVINLARFVQVDPEIALKKANSKFQRRFYEMEKSALARDRVFADLPREEMESLWVSVKQNETKKSPQLQMSSRLNPATTGIAVRKCQTLEDFQYCVALQREIWEEEDLEVEPVTAFVVAANTGGQVIGAFDNDRLIGFTLALVGLRENVPYLHSHMTGVHHHYRDRGVGRMLKLFQREEALSRNIRTIRWTFDPLEIRNAYFNLNRLGAICRNYLPNLYGVTTSPLHRGLATDRLLAEWHLDTPRVVAAVAGVLAHVPENSAVIELSSDSAEPPAADKIAAQHNDQFLASPSADTQRLTALQSHLRNNFQKYFQRGYAAIAVRTGGSVPAYQLYPWSDF